jgi:TAT (twin-arginine translocation) pathway signal sequence
MRRTIRPSTERKRPSKISRRGFLAGGAAAIAVAATGPGLLESSSPAQSARSAALSSDQARTLQKFVRDLFPHDRLDDSYYARAIAPLKEEAKKDADTRRLLAEGVARVDNLSREAAGKPYRDVEDEEQRVEIIKKIEGSPFFTKVYGDSIVGLYNQPEVWSRFGYEGPSSAKGGYLHRGFNDITWA